MDKQRKPCIGGLNTYNTYRCPNYADHGSSLCAYHRDREPWKEYTRTSDPQEPEK